MLGLNVLLDSRHIIGHFGDDFTDQMTQTTGWII